MTLHAEQTNIMKTENNSIIRQKPSPLVWVGLFGSGERVSEEKSDIAIIDMVCIEFNVSHKVLTGLSRFREIVLPRQIAMFLLRRYTGMSLKHIGTIFNRDHATVIHSCDVVNDLKATDKDYAARLQRLEARV